jgi:molybdate transport system substrate-binding protein
MKLIRVLVLLLASPFPLARGDSITVSAAISMKDALEEVARAYEARSGDDVQLNFGSSGQLMTQIARGAPVDVFISAAEEQMDQLARDQQIDPQTRVDVAGNRLVLIVPGDPTGTPTSFERLADHRFKRISIGQPDSVPAGKYAMQVLTKLGLSDAVRDRLAYGANVRQVLSYVERGEVEAGIVYRTDALAARMVFVAATADASWHEPIRYPAAVVSASKHRDAARRFVESLRQAEAQQILTRHGFTSPPATQPAR